MWGFWGTIVCGNCWIACLVRIATPSNCGNTLKLHLPSWIGKPSNGRANSPGYGNNDEDGTMGNPQPSPKSVIVAGAAVIDMDAVHRLNGGGWTLVVVSA